MEDEAARLRKDMGLMTAREVAFLIGSTEGTLRAWRGLKRGPAYVNLGSQVMYRREDVMAWIASRLRGGELSKVEGGQLYKTPRGPKTIAEMTLEERADLCAAGFENCKADLAAAGDFTDDLPHNES